VVWSSFLSDSSQGEIPPGKPGGISRSDRAFLLSDQREAPPGKPGGIFRFIQAPCCSYRRETPLGQAEWHPFRN
jgi:hypothetical protein